MRVSTVHERIYLRDGGGDVCIVLCNHEFHHGYCLLSSLNLCGDWEESNDRPSNRRRGADAATSMANASIKIACWFVNPENGEIDLVEREFCARTSLDLGKKR